jgi:3-oxoadipate enol-lactonase
MSFDPIDHDFERGLQNRRSVLGDEWVDRSLNKANSFNADFQNLITRFAWNEIWGRPGLDHKTRRAIVLSITIALGRWEEFELHIRAALLGAEGSRLTPDEIKEILMQSAIYAGVPAANTAFTHTLAILREVGEQIGYVPEPAAPASAAHSGVGREGRTASSPALHYSVREPRSGKAPRHTVVLSHALGCDLTMWDALANELAFENRVIAYDHRGHGSSDAPDAPYAMADLADDAARLLRELDTGPVVWVGLSMGGMVGQELALHHPSLVRALVLANTTSGYPEAARAVWEQRIETVRSEGIEAIADAVMGRYFHDAFRAQKPATVARFRRRLVSTDTVGYAGCCNAVGKVDTTARLGQIAVPTLVIAGELDQGTPVAMAQTLAEAIPGAQLEVLADASHLSAAEQPEAFAKSVVGFVAGL